MPKRLICITGLDGTGKSTLIEGIRTHITSVYLSTIWDLMTDPVKGLPFKSKQQVDNFLCELTPDSRLFFLAHAMKYSIDKALKSRKENILIDSYYYKYFASELILGADSRMVDALQQVFPKPDFVFELVLPPEEAARRKSHFSRYECGLSKKPGMTQFLDFQKKVTFVWDLFDSNTWQRIDARMSSGNVLNETLKHLL
jgi:thymidylate kinase